MAEEPEASSQISIRQFFETQLRVARIISAEKVANADKLLKLQCGNL